MAYHDYVIDPPKPSKSRRLSRPLILLLVVAPLVLSSCGVVPGGAGKTSSSNTNTSVVTFAPNSTMGTIKTRGHLIVGVRFDAPPFAYQDPNLGSPAGFDVQMVQSIATTIFGTSDIEGKVTWVPLDPKDFELALEQSKVDIVVGRYAISAARKQFVDFAGPYFASPQTIVIRSNAGAQTQIGGFADLNGRRVCVVTGSTDVAALKSVAPNADTSDAKATVNQCGADLLAGTVDAIAADHVDELGFLQNASGVTALAASYGTQEYGIGVKKGTDDLRTFLNDEITTFDWDGDYRQTIGTDSNALEQPPVDRY